MVTFGFSLRQTWQTLCLDIGLLGKTYIKLNTFNFKDGFKIRQFYPSQRSTPLSPAKNKNKTDITQMLARIPL